MLLLWFLVPIINKCGSNFKPSFPSTFVKASSTPFLISLGSVTGSWILISCGLLGGTGFLVLITCMAAARTSVSNSSTKSQALLLFLGLFFIVLLFARPADQLRISMASSLPTERRLADSSTASQSTVKYNPQQTKKTHTSSGGSTSRQFEAGAHEVPSGPNPISNR
ncbi:hypothetical protein HHK36_013029 [Tetracentron sinense]|uniref:Uncharacterized protein n=1 Tax=Tetracentron sinense TaxID=13715 RepID=A0A835DIR6_TETSI|nr:hypothetical protein HHK36_013029 [Tetracentron sinense]